MSRQVGIASLIWGMSILLSRVVGLVREAVIGRVIGGGSEADAFWTSFIVPDFLNYLLAGGALSIVFIPIFNGYLSREDEDGAWRAFSHISTLLLVGLGVLLPLLWFAVPTVAPWIAPGFDAEQIAELVHLTRIMLPAQLFHLTGGLLSAALQARDRHALPALAPLFYTGSIIVGGLVVGTAEGFAWGVLVGSVLGPFGLPLIGNLRVGIRWKPRLALFDDDVKAYLIRSLPIMLGFSILVVDDWILRHQGSQLAAGSISSLQYAKTLMKVPMGVFGLATGVAAYPTLTRMLGMQQRSEAFELLSTSVRNMLVLAFGAQVCLTVAGSEIAQVIYGDRIPLSQYADIGAAVSLFGCGLWAWSSQTVLARGFYAQGRTWFPTVLGSVAVLVTLPLYVWCRKEYGVAGLAGASSVAISAYVLALVLFLRRDFPGCVDDYGRFVSRMIPSVLLGIAAGKAVGAWLVWDQPLGRGVVLVAVGGVVYLGAVMVLDVPEAKQVVKMVRQRWRRHR